MQRGAKRCVLYEHDGFDADNLLRDLEERLEEDALYGVFAGEDDIDAHIDRLCAELGVPPPEGAAPSGTDEAASPSPAQTPARSEVQVDALAERRSSA